LNLIDDSERAFIDFISKYHRSYGTKEEYNYRLSLFEKAYNDVLYHNENNVKTHGFTKEINIFSDMSDYELSGLYGYIPPTEAERANILEAPENYVSASNGNFDWRPKGVVTGVKDQGGCGACYAFAATGAMEGAYAIKHKSLISISEQQIVDCSSSYGNNGCNGGNNEKTFLYA